MLDSGARGATTTFTENGQGDVLIAWENEAFLALKEDPDKYDIVVPSVSILCQPTVAVVDEVVDERGTRGVATEYLSYLYSDDKGTIYQSYTNNGSNQGVFASFHASKYLFNKLNIDFDIAYSFTESKVGDNRHTYNSLSYTLFAVLRLPKSYSLRAIVFGTTRKAISHNAYRKDPTNIDLELTKRLKRWNIGFSVSDIFDSHKKGGNVTIDMGDYTQTVSNNVSYRSYQLKLSYNFNWGKAGRVRRAETQKSDMSGRIGRN